MVERYLPLLERTPAALDALLRGLPDAWQHLDEGPRTWSPHQVISHLIHAERTDWMPRVRLILEHGTRRPFDPSEREPPAAACGIETLLDEFTSLRRENLASLRALQLRPEHGERQGQHPALGVVTLNQLLATWTAHDLAHLLQVSRVMAKGLRAEVGPWAEYLSVMKS